MADLHLQFVLPGHDGEADVQLSRVLAGLSGDLDDLGPAHELIHQNFLEGEHGTFALEGAFEGKSSWSPLSPKYLEWKQSRYGDLPVLVLTGSLRASLTDAGHPDHVYESDGQELTIGTRARTPDGSWNLGLLHQLGTKKMPARRPVELTQPQKSRWVGILHQWLWEERMPWHLERELAPPR